MVALQQRTGPCHQMVPIFNHAQVAAAAQKRQTREVHGFDWIIVFFFNGYSSAFWGGFFSPWFCFL